MLLCRFWIHASFIIYFIYSEEVPEDWFTGLKPLCELKLAYIKDFLASLTSRGFYALYCFYRFTLFYCFTLFYRGSARSSTGLRPSKLGLWGAAPLIRKRHGGTLNSRWFHGLLGFTLFYAFCCFWAFALFPFLPVVPGGGGARVPTPVPHPPRHPGTPARNTQHGTANSCPWHRQHACPSSSRMNPWCTERVRTRVNNSW